MIKDMKKIKMQKINKVLKNKHAQEEILGFVLIILIVVVAAVFLLAMSLNKPAEQKESTEARNLLQSVLAYTTNCAVRYEPEYYSIQDLISSCYSGENCENLGLTSCEVLNSTLLGLFSSGLGNLEVLKVSRINAYSFSAVTEDNSTLISVSAGNCSFSEYGAYQPIETSGGKINIFLKLCYGSNA